MHYRLISATALQNRLPSAGLLVEKQKVPAQRRRSAEEGYYAETFLLLELALIRRLSHSGKKQAMILKTAAVDEGKELMWCYIVFLCFPSDHGKNAH